MVQREKAVAKCIAKGYDLKYPQFHIAIHHEMPGWEHHPCKWCGGVAYKRIRGALTECSGCWEVTSRLTGFLQDGGEAARQFVREALQ